MGSLAGMGPAAGMESRAVAGHCSIAGERAWAIAPLDLTPAAAEAAAAAGTAPRVGLQGGSGAAGGNGGSGLGGVDGTCNLTNCTVAWNRGNAGLGGAGGAAGWSPHPVAPGATGTNGAAWGGTACGPSVNTLIAWNTPAGGDSFPDPKRGPLADNGGPTL